MVVQTLIKLEKELSDTLERMCKLEERTKKFYISKGLTELFDRMESPTKAHKQPVKAKQIVVKDDSDPLTIFTDYGFSDQQIKLIFENRKKNAKTAKSAKITKIIADSICKQMTECTSLGYTIDTVLKEWHESTWVTFKAEWIQNRIPIKTNAGQQSQEFKDWVNQSDVIDGGDCERIG